MAAAPDVVGVSIECTVCSLPQSVRSDIAAMRAKAVTYREMSWLLSERGYLVGTSKDSIARCLRDHGTAGGGLPSAEGAAENLVAAVVAEVLGELGESLRQVAERLRETRAPSFDFCGYAHGIGPRM